MFYSQTASVESQKVGWFFYKQAFSIYFFNLLFHGFDPLAQWNIGKFFVINNKHIKHNETRMVAWRFRESNKKLHFD